MSFTGRLQASAELLGQPFVKLHCADLPQRIRFGDCSSCLAWSLGGLQTLPCIRQWLFQMSLFVHHCDTCLADFALAAVLVWVRVAPVAMAFVAYHASVYAVGLLCRHSWEPPWLPSFCAATCSRLTQHLLGQWPSCNHHLGSFPWPPWELPWSSRPVQSGPLRNSKHVSHLWLLALSLDLVWAVRA